MTTRPHSDDLPERGLSVRWRLTVVYTAVSVASAAVLLAGVYVLVSVSQPSSDQFVCADAPCPGGPDLSLPPSGEDVVIDRGIVEAVDHALRNLLIWSGIGLVLMALVSVIVGWMFAGRALRPVHTITARARRISADSLDERLALEGPHDELREMAETFDSLLDRIQEAFRSERRLVATMSHELRTPLANQRAALDVALADPDATNEELRRAGQVALGQVDRAQRTVDALLTLARVQAGVEDARLASVTLDEVVTAAVKSTRQHTDLQWHVEIDPATVTGDADLLTLAVTNLLRNAMVHNQPGGGWVRVRLAAGVGTTVLEIENSGPVLDPATVSSLTLPFRRGAADRTASGLGTGLGLTIVQAVADHHHAKLSLTARDGGGLRVTLTVTAPPPREQ